MPFDAAYGLAALVTVGLVTAYAAADPAQTTVGQVMSAIAIVRDG